MVFFCSVAYFCHLVTKKKAGASYSMDSCEKKSAKVASFQGK
jgi:hypothetical protein